MPDYLKSQTLYVDAEVPTGSGVSIPSPAGSKKEGSTFKFSKAVSGIAKGGLEEESSYHERGDGKFQDGSNFQKK